MIIKAKELPGPFPYKVVDGEGNIREEPITEFDPKTGEITYHKLDENGQRIIDYEKGCIVTETLTIPAPITYFPAQGQ